MKKVLATILIAALLLGGCSLKKEEKQGTKWVDGAYLRIGDMQIDYREGLVYLDATRSDYEQYYGSEIWTYTVRADGSTLQDIIKQQVLDEMIYVKIVCAQAEKMNVSLTGDELAIVDAQTEDYMLKLQGSDLLKQGINKDIVRKVYQDNALARKVFEQATLNIDTNISNDEAGQHHVYSFAVRNYKIGSAGERVEYSAEEKAELKARVENMRNDAILSEDFLKYATGVTEDSEMLDVFVGKGSLNSAIEQEVLSLQDGECSSVLETSDYFYVFYCASAFDIDKTMEKKEEIIATRQEEAFEAFYTQWRTETDVELNEEVWQTMNYVSAE